MNLCISIVVTIIRRALAAFFSHYNLASWARPCFSLYCSQHRAANSILILCLLENSREQNVYLNHKVFQHWKCLYVYASMYNFFFYVFYCFEMEFSFLLLLFLVTSWRQNYELLPYWVFTPPTWLSNNLFTEENI